MPNIAVVGTDGSGKTVFITTLAKRFSTDNALGAFMDPRTRRTVLYVEQAWETLSNSEWPASTSPGELFDLRWQIKWGWLAGDIRLVDCAGHDLRLLFAGADEQTPVENLPSHLKELREYCLSAHILLLMINLKDFMGESNVERRVANEWALKYLLDSWTCRTRGRCALVFSQVDQYKAEVHREGGWKAVVKRYLPNVYGAHLGNGNIAVMAVASVNETTVTSDGHRVPARGFSSHGLEAMVTWIGQQIRSVVEEEQQREAEEQRQSAIQRQQEVLTAQEDDERKKRREQEVAFGKHLGRAGKSLAVLGIFYLVLRGCGWFSSAPSIPAQLAAPTVPLPEFVDLKHEREFGTGDFETYGLEVYGTVANRGAAGNIIVTCTVTQGDQSWNQARTVWLGAGEKFFYDFKETHPYQVNGRPTSVVRLATSN